MDGQAIEFSTDTPKIKRTFVGLAAFLVISFSLIGVVKHRPLADTIEASIVFPSALLTFLWIYGEFKMFDRTYSVSDLGITVSRHGRVLSKIAWQDVRHVSKGHLAVAAHDGRSISFDLPPSVQTEARSLINERLKEHNYRSQIQRPLL